jgi:signal transduction histidine kinase
LELIHNLINIYKYETAGITVVTLQEVDFARMVRDQVEQLRIVALSKALTFETALVGKKYAPGTGLGLYLCRSIVTAHGGTIELVDSEQPGTTIRVCLPVSRIYDASVAPPV